MGLVKEVLGKAIINEDKTSCNILMEARYTNQALIYLPPFFMPRILPRLIERLQATKPKKPFEPFNLHEYRARSKSIRKPLPPTPSFHPADYSQSILLSPGNPIISSRDYIRHKSLPPRVRLPKDAIPGKNAYDRPRNMTEQERRWWASPYRMFFSLLIEKISTCQPACSPNGFYSTQTVFSNFAVASIR